MNSLRAARKRAEQAARLQAQAQRQVLPPPSAQADEFAKRFLLPPMVDAFDQEPVGDAEFLEGSERTRIAANGAPIPSDWSKGQLLNVRNAGHAYRVTLLGEEYDSRSPERCLEFTNSWECQQFVSDWYAREPGGRPW